MSRKQQQQQQPPRPQTPAPQTPAPPTPPAPVPSASRRQAVIALFVCSALLVVFALLALYAVDSKAPTYDEPLHTVGAWLHLHKRDFRVNPEDPPLWHYWAALPNGSGALNPRMDTKEFRTVADDVFWEWQYVVDVLFRTEGNKGDVIVARSRRMMLIVGVALGGVIAWWSWRLGGLAAAVAATAAFALDPNFLAHAPLVKNDVSLTLVMLLLAIAVWRAGQRLTAWNMLAIGVLCGAGLTIKFSALLLGPIVLILLLVRAWMPQPWQAFGRFRMTRGQRLVTVAGVCVAAALISYASIWACYGFRYLPTPEPKLVLNTRNIINFLAHNELTERYGDDFTAEQVAAWRPGLFSRAVLFAEKRWLLPQAWLNGLLYTQQSAILRKTYLLGEFSKTGWWYYFPLAMLFKTPLALLAAAAGAVAVGAAAHRQQPRLLREHGWTIACFAVPVGIYLFSAMTSNLNIGIRHVLPIYPFFFIAIGVAVSYALRQRRKLVKVLGLALITALGVETLAAFPNYIAFFNATAGGSRGGIRLLGDSNLDWGQDLRRLGQWHQDHPDVPLSLCYFGTADPWFYGIENYVNLPGGYPFGPVHGPPTAPGVVAISATQLQGIYLEDQFRRVYHHIWKNVKPIEVLGGTIYLYSSHDVLTAVANLPPLPATTESRPRVPSPRG